MLRDNSLEKTLMLGGIAGRRRRGRHPTRWTWVWVNSRSWWWTGRPGVVRFVGSQRVGYDWVTELNWMFHCTSVPDLLYPFLCWWTFRFLPRLSDFTFTFHFHALEKEMATHSSVLAWRIPGMGEPGGLLSLGSHRVGHDWSDLAAAAAAGFFHLLATVNSAAIKTEVHVSFWIMVFSGFMLSIIILLSFLRISIEKLTYNITSRGEKMYIAEKLKETHIRMLRVAIFDGFTHGWLFSSIFPKLL